MSVTLHTSVGDLKVEVFCDRCPKASENFLALCASGAYNDTLFHRLIPGFMVQGGDTNGTGGQSIWGTPFKDELSAGIKHNRRGVLSMANKGPDTNGSQFFVCFQPAPHLDGSYTVFGQMIAGDDALTRMEKTPTRGETPARDIVLRRVTIHANPLA